MRVDGRQATLLYIAFIWTIFTCLIQGVDARAEPSVHAEYLVVDDGRQAKIVEDVGAIPPHVHRPVLSRCVVSWRVVAWRGG